MSLVVAATRARAIAIMTTTWTIPSDGITLQYGSVVNDLPQIIKLNTNDTVTREILRAVKRKETTKIKLGTRCSIATDSKTIPLNHIRQKTAVDLFRGDLDGSKPFFFTGSSSHVLEVHSPDRKLPGAVAGSVSSLKSSQNVRPSADLLGAALRVPNQGRPSPLIGTRLLSESRCSSPFLAGRSPRDPPPTSNTLMIASDPKESARMEAIKIPMIHLLAVQPQTVDELADKLRVKHLDCAKVMDKVARDDMKAGKGKKTLRDKSYQSLDVWKFPYISQHDRQAAIDNAVSAYDRMRLGKSDKSWQMLLAAEDRGKGTCLSRLTHFDKQLTGSLTPKLPERSQDGSTAGKSMHSSGSGTNSKDSKASDEISTAKTTPLMKPKVQMTAATVKRIMSGKPAQKPAPVKSAKATAEKKDTKYKSAERIENSDEEGEGGISVSTARTSKALARPKGDGLPRVSLAARTAASAAKANTAKLPAASSNTEGGAIRSKAEAAVQANPSLAASNPTARVIGSASHLKSSPLASSTQTTSKDSYTLNSSSQVVGQSATVGTSSPVTSAGLASDRRTTSLADSPNKAENVAKKRKADGSVEVASAKRQQISRPPTKTHALMQDLQEKSPPDSDTSSTTGLSVASLAELQDRAQKFQIDYTTYKALLEKLDSKSPAQRDETEVENVWRMHRRLEERKEQIWKDWERTQKRNGT